jgi:uncharacterized membrane protein YedE/YeeE
MTDFNPWLALAGGGLIGLAATMLMLLLGRIAGISGIVAGCLDGVWRERRWRAAFVAGLVAPPLLAGAAGFHILPPEMPTNMALIAVGGLLVGFGTRLGGGCTSGHGVCGIARLSPRSIVATAIFMLTAMMVVAITHHAIGG